MNPLHFKVPRQTGETVKVETWHLDYFYDPIHFHDEFQLTYVIEGEGSLFVREISKSFKSGDVLLFGKNLPHVLRCHDSYYQGNPNLHARAVSVFFSQDTLKETLAKLPEAYAIQRLIEYAIHGIRVPSEVAAEIGSKVERIIKQTGFERVLSLLDVLHDVSNNENLKSRKRLINQKSSVLEIGGMQQCGPCFPMSPCYTDILVNPYNKG